MENHQLESYFNRIGFSSVANPDFETLAAIQQLHTAAIPFENLNPLLGLPVILTEEALFKKLVIDHRGGYCFEQNLLLKAVLRKIGFEVRGLLGRAGIDEISAGRTHMVLLVMLNNKPYTVDTGYGGLVPTAPLLLEPGLIQQTPKEDYRIIQNGDEYRLEILLTEGWQRLYEFNLLHQTIKDYEVANWYTSTCPDSRFTHQLVAARSDKACRYTLSGQHFSIHKADSPHQKILIDSLPEMKKILTEVFKINLNGLPNLEKLVQLSPCAQ